LEIKGEIIMSGAKTDERWSYDTLYPGGEGGHRVYAHESKLGEQITGRPLTPTGWVEDLITNEPRRVGCSQCKYELEHTDKRFQVYWIHELTCPCCERRLYIRGDGGRDHDESLDSVQAEYVESDVMSEASLEASVAYFL
jgi:hypothetical protein